MFCRQKKKKKKKKKTLQTNWGKGKLVKKTTPTYHLDREDHPIRQNKSEDNQGRHHWHSLQI